LALFQAFTLGVATANFDFVAKQPLIIYTNSEAWGIVRYAGFRITIFDDARAGIIGAALPCLYRSLCLPEYQTVEISGGGTLPYLFASLSPGHIASAISQ
jgi:hypothetical protein